MTIRKNPVSESLKTVATVFHSASVNTVLRCSDTGTTLDGNAGGELVGGVG